MTEESATLDAVLIDQAQGNFTYPEDYEHDAGRGLGPETLNYISEVKGEDQWIRDFRHRALEVFERKPMPTSWASRDLDNIKFQDIRYYLSKGRRPTRSWDEVPDDVKKTFERLGIPERERGFLAGVEAQFDSEAAYSNIKEEFDKLGVIFMNSSEALREHPEIFRKWFGKVIPTGDNKFSALNSAVFSGGSFIYVPPGVKVKHPLQAYFRINAEQFGDRGLIAVVSDHEGKGGRLSLFEPVEDRLGQDRVAIDKAWCKGPAATGDAGEGLGGDPA